MKSVLLVALATVALTIFALVPSGGEIILPTIVSIVSGADHQWVVAMAVAAPMIRKPRRYLRKLDVRVRYGWASVISVDRAWKKYGTLPPPTTWRGRFPLWAEDILDEHDARARESTVVVSPELKEARRALYLPNARQHLRARAKVEA
jgi:hypothetical protein